MALTHMGDIPNLHIRDFQRSRLYKAESTCHFWNNVDFLSIDETIEVITKISDDASIDMPYIDLIGDENLPLVYATATDIVLPSSADRTLPCICHEMAHVINYQKGPADHHGPNFAKCYLELVHKWIGPVEYSELMKAFNSSKVHYKEVVLV